MRFPSRPVLYLAASTLMAGVSLFGHAQAAAAAEAPATIALPWSTWTAHPGDDPRCAAMADAGCTWQHIADVSSIAQLDFWQQTRVQLPAAFQGRPLGLLMQGLDPPYEVFVNGQSIGGPGGVGEMRLARMPWSARAILTVPPILTAHGELVVAVHGTSLAAVQVSTASLGFDPALGPTDALRTIVLEQDATYARAEWQHYLCFFVVFCIGLVFLLLYGLDRGAPEYFWLGMQFVGVAARRFFELAAVVDMGLRAVPATVLYTLADALMPMMIVGFVFAFIGKPAWKTARLAMIWASLDALALILLLPLPDHLLRQIAPIFLAVQESDLIAWSLLALLWLLPVPACFRSKHLEMRAIGVALLFLSLEECNRYLGELRVAHLPQEVQTGALNVDLRGLAWAIFSILMLVAMTVRFRRIQRRNQAVEQEMAAARTVQQVLIPDFLPAVAGLIVESAYIPAQEVGGDFFQVLPIPGGGDAFIVVGDVSGKGLQAAMTVSLLVGTLRTLAEYVTSPAEMLAGLNRRLHGRDAGFATCLVLKITPEGDVTIANAGHPNPYLDGVEVSTESDLPLGLSLDVAYAETCLHIDLTQSFTLVTDGVVEATRSTTRELFGFDRTQAISRQAANAIAEAARLFGAGAPQADDITVLTVARV